ncbi:MAG: PfkB family carbohydrate kinase, partial [Hyphomicrobiales bacterium]
MIVCIGEALVDMIPRTLPSGDESYLPISGGAVFNTSIALSRLGSKAALLTGLSNDLFGQQIRASLLQSGVETDLIVTSDRPTTLAFVKLINGSAQYSFFDENSAMRMLALSDLGVFPKSAKALFMGGISLAIEPFGVACKEYLGTLNDDIPVMVDPNIRPTFISDEKAYRERLQTIIARSDIIKV